MSTATATRTADSPTAAVEEQVLRKIFRRLIAFLVLLFVFSFLDRINIGFAALSMNKELGLTAAQFGIASSIFYAGYVLLEIPSNMMLAKYGARRWIARIVFSFGLASAATMFATGPWSLYALRMLVGITEAGFLPGILLYLTFWFPPTYRARATSLFLVSQAFVFAIAAPLSGFILDNTHDLLGLSGWQWLFVIEGLPAVALGVMTYFYLSDGPHDARWLSETEKAALKSRLERERDALGAKPGKHEVLRQVLRPDCLILGVVNFGLVCSLMTNSTWIPQIIREAAAARSFAHVGLLITIPSVVTMIVMPLWGAHSDRTMERKWHVALGLLAAAGGWILIALQNTPELRVLGLVFCVAGTYAAQGVFWTIPPRVFTEGARPVGIAFVNACGVFASFLSPLIVGFLRETTHGWTAPLMFVAVMLVNSSALVAFAVSSKDRSA